MRWLTSVRTLSQVVSLDLRNLATGEAIEKVTKAVGEITEAG